jgi:hypothetical protein
MDVYSTELGIRLSFSKTLNFGGGGGLNPQIPLRYATVIGDRRFGTIHSVPMLRTPITQVRWRNNPQRWKVQPHNHENLKTRIPLQVVTVRAAVQIL